MDARRLRRITAVVVLALVAAASIYTGRLFVGMWAVDPVFPGPGVTARKMLSDYVPQLKDSAGDTEVFVLAGTEPGGTLSVTGGVHGDEISGWIAAIILVENAVVTRGRLVVIPRSNPSNLTHSEPQEGYPQRVHFTTRGGSTRTFRFGSRIANPVHYWPDPEVYVHRPSGQNLSGSEVRNLNRSFPGRLNGSFTERIAYGIRKVILDEKVKMQVDLHEAPIEYPFINAIGAHERAKDIATIAAVNLQARGIDYRLELSPPRFHGLTYRELGDFTPVLAILMETANPVQGRLHGITDEALVIDGRDAFYEQASRLGRTFVKVDERGWPLDVRVGRHLEALKELWAVFSEMDPENAIEIRDVPGYDELKKNGVGYYLRALR